MAMISMMKYFKMSFLIHILCNNYITRFITSFFFSKNNKSRKSLNKVALKYEHFRLFNTM